MARQKSRETSEMMVSTVVPAEIPECDIAALIGWFMF